MDVREQLWAKLNAININMRCIEISFHGNA